MPKPVYHQLQEEKQRKNQDATFQERFRAARRSLTRKETVSLVSVAALFVGGMCMAWAIHSDFPGELRVGLFLAGLVSLLALFWELYGVWREAWKYPRGG